MKGGLAEAGRLNKEAIGLFRAGRFADATPLFEQALKIVEKVRGPEHPDVATSLNGLGALYHVQGRYAEAERLYKRSLAILEKGLGQSHPDVATILDNLAVLYRNTKRTAEAEKLKLQAARIRAKKP